MTIKETEVGKEYLVINGAWNFIVKSKTDTYTTIYAPDIKKEWDVQHDIPNEMMVLEECNYEEDDNIKEIPF